MTSPRPDDAPSHDDDASEPLPGDRTAASLNDDRAVPSSTGEAAAEHDDLTRYLHRTGASLDAAEDLASEAIARLWVAGRNGFVPRSRTAYLRTVARRLLVDLIRRERRERARNETIAIRLHLDARAACHGDPQHQILTLAVDMARAQLPPRYRRVLECTLDQQMTLEQTAEALGLPSPGAAGVLAHRARKALVKLLRAQGI